MDSLTGIAHQISSLPDLKVNVKGGISFEGSMSYGDTVFSGSVLKETLFNSPNIKNIDKSIIKELSNQARGLEIQKRINPKMSVQTSIDNLYELLTADFNNLKLEINFY